MSEVSFKDFKKVQLRTGTILSVEEFGDKLYKLRVNADKERTLLAGLKQSYSKTELEGKKVIIVANLEPKEMRGVLSEGMLLAAEKDGKVSLLTPDKDMLDGSEIY